MLKELQEIGLSEKEAKVYLASLELGKATADRIAKHTGIKRPTTYVQIKSLMEKGLMSTYEEDKKTFFAPESPEHLKRLIEKQRQTLLLKEKELKSAIPELSRMFESAGERPIVRFFNGKEGITSMREESLKIESGETIYVIYSYDALLSVYSEKEIIEFSRKREESGLKIKLIYTRGAGKFNKNNITQGTNRRYLSSNKLKLNSDFFIFENKVAVMSLRKKIFGVTVESQEISESMKSLFNLLWEIAEEE